MFVDEAKVFIASGKGGDGAVSFHKEKYKPKGGPDGGNGGRGGSVILIADPNIGSLVELRDHPHQKAQPGGNGARNNRTGADGKDLVLRVPVGTIVKDEHGVVLADLAMAEDRVVIARGGRGGRGNASFQTHARRVPGFGELGEPGEQRTVLLELRLIADVAVIGYPNCGKSTLVGALSAAHPKVGDYPFTTIEPSLGVVETERGRFTICDIPGLIEGAHTGRGLGHRFLRHAERAPVFLHMIDMTSTEGSAAHRYEVVSNELERFRSDLATRPQLIALNKVDVADPDLVAETLDQLRSRGLQTLPISALSGEGLDVLVDQLQDLVARAREEARGAEGFELFRSAETKISVEPEGTAWRIKGGPVLRWVAMTDMSNSEAVSYLQNRMERAGVERALADAGAKPGDEVRIADIVFEWWPAGVEPPR